MSAPETVTLEHHLATVAMVRRAAIEEAVRVCRQAASDGGSLARGWPEYCATRIVDLRGAR